MYVYVHVYIHDFLILQFLEFLKKASIRTTNNTLPTPRARSDDTKRKDIERPRERQ